MGSRSALAVLALTVIASCGASSDDSEVGEQQGAWEAESSTNETDSTHLWIVDRAIELLKQHASEDDVAARAVSLLDAPRCRTNWQQGLLDADFKAVYNNGRRDLPVPASNAKVLIAGTSWESHFFDPDTKTNYKGATSPTAYTEATAHGTKAIAQGLASAEGCYELGLALHYYTDLTQPMHAANFTFKSRPLSLHTNLETYALEIQGRYPLADWSGKPSGTLDGWIIQTARDAKALHGANIAAISRAYERAHARGVRWCGEVDTNNLFERQYYDFKRCWSGDAGVDTAVGNSLLEAQDHTAKYVYLVVEQLADGAAAP